MLINGYLLVPLYFLVGLYIAMLMYKAPGKEATDFLYFLCMVLWPIVILLIPFFAIQLLIEWNAEQKDIFKRNGDN
jgi:L-lactate permease